MKRKDTPKDSISKAIDVLIDSGVDLSTLFDQGGLLKQLSKRLIEKALESEMDSHLGYNKHARSDSENARNGLSSKQVITDSTPVPACSRYLYQHKLTNVRLNM